MGTSGFKDEPTGVEGYRAAVPDPQPTEGYGSAIPVPPPSPGPRYSTAETADAPDTYRQVAQDELRNLWQDSGSETDPQTTERAKAELDEAKTNTVTTHYRV